MSKDTTNTTESLDKILIELVEKWAEFMLNGKSPDGAIAIAQAKQAIQQEVLRGRVDELSGVRLDYGPYQAETFTGGKQQGVLNRINELNTLLGGENDG
jgi:hypothetical protein